MHAIPCQMLFFLICKDMVQILLMLKVLFTQVSNVEDLFCAASLRLKPARFDPVQDDF